MKLAITALCLFVAALWPRMASAVTFPDETLHYVVSYKWGLIHKEAGDANVTLRNRGNNYEMTLIGKTRPWADRFYSVRDTLLATVGKNGFRPLKYEKITHEKGKYARDVITYSYHGNITGGRSLKYRTDKKTGTPTVKETMLTASGAAFDFLSVFYYLRTIDYSSLSKDRQIVTTVFSGSKSETLTIRYIGEETVKIRDKSAHKAYHIRFRFTQKGKKKSSDDIDTWISVAASHVPLSIVGNLPVGQVRCILSSL